MPDLLEALVLQPLHRRGEIGDDVLRSRRIRGAVKPPEETPLGTDGAREVIDQGEGSCRMLEDIHGGDKVKGILGEALGFKI